MSQRYSTAEPPCNRISARKPRFEREKTCPPWPGAPFRSHNWRLESLRQRASSLSEWSALLRGENSPVGGDVHPTLMEKAADSRGAAALGLGMSRTVLLCGRISGESYWLCSSRLSSPGPARCIEGGNCSGSLAPRCWHCEG